MKEEISFEIQKKHSKIFIYFFELIKGKLKEIDCKSSSVGKQTFFTKDYLIIGFELWKNLERDYRDNSTTKAKFDGLGTVNDDLIGGAICIALFSIESDKLDFGENDFFQIISNLRLIEDLYNGIIELESKNDNVDKKLYYNAFLLQLVYPEEYPKGKYTNQKALIEAKGLMEYGKEFIDKENTKTQHFINVLEYYKHFKNKLRKKLAL